MKRPLVSLDQSLQNGRWFLPVSILSGVVLVLLSGPAPVSAQDKPSVMRAQSDEDNSEEESDDAEEVPDRFRRVSQRKTVAEPKYFQTAATSDGPGIIGQAGYLAFKTFGRNTSIAPLEAMPYILTDEHFIFSDLRGFVSNGGLFGGNFGLGYRHLREDLNAWYGGSLWYDVDGTTGRNYQQVGLSFETLFSRWELRSNVYLPVTSAQVYSNTIGNERIIGHQLLYTRFVDQGKALQGVDFEAGYNLPVKDRHRLRGFVGYYHFNGGPSGGLNGFKTRIEGVINNSVTAQVLYTNDRLFGNNIMVGCSVQFPWGDSHPTSSWKQNTPSPFRFVERNYNVIVDRGTHVDDGLVAINPQTHAAYTIQQVNSTAGGGGNGTAANPFQTVAQAQSAGGDVILVRRNSVLTTGVTLAPGQHLLGDGSLQPLSIGGGEFVHLPTQVAGGATPRFDGVLGAAVNMGANSEVAGFAISNNNGNAIVGSGTAGATIRDISFQNITGDAIHFTNATGQFIVQNVTVNTTSGSGITFIGGAPDLTLSGSVTGTQNDGVFLSNLSGGSVDIFGTSISLAGGAGLRLNNVSADVDVDGLSVSQTTGSGVAITGGTSSNTYHFGHTTTINQPGGNGLNVNNTNAAVTVDNLLVNSTATTPAISLTNSAGKITLGSVDVDTTNAVALYGRSLTSLVVNGGSLTTINAGAIDVQNSVINMSLSQVSVDGGAFGIKLIQNTGVFGIVGSDNYATGGTIKNTTTGVIMTSTGITNVNWMDLTNNGTGIQTTGNSQLTFNGLRITGSSGYALDAMNDQVLIVRNSTLTNNGSVGGGTIRAQVNTTGNYEWLVERNVITDHNGTPILMQTLAGGNGASLGTTVQQNAITADRATMSLISMNWNGPLSVGVVNNTLSIGANNMTGINLADQSAADSIVARVTANQILVNGSQGTGMLISAAAGSQLQVDNNQMDFKGVAGTGLRFNLAGISSAWIYSNAIADEAGSATGMLFDTVAASSRMQIEANTINLLSNDLTIHRGIIFSAVTPTVQFSGNYNNIITNASTVFSIPVNSSTGKIIINGALWP